MHHYIVAADPLHIQTSTVSHQQAAMTGQHGVLNRIHDVCTSSLI